MGDLEEDENDGRERRRPRERRRDALVGAGSLRLVLVCEPDHLGVERPHPQLAFGVRLIELAEPNRHVAPDDDRTPTGRTATRAG
jgi:hypothetical protein